MKRSLTGSAKRYLLTGILVILPAWLAVLLVLALVQKVGILVAPISQHLPAGIGHPTALAIVLIVAACVVVGMLVGTGPGHQLRKLIEEKILERVPGYSALRSLTAQITGDGTAGRFQPALVAMDDGLVPAFLVETHADGRCTVFVPTAPTPAAGNIFIVSAERVYPTDVPVMKLFQCVSHWGMGSGELLASTRRSTLPPTSDQPVQLRSPAEKP